MAKMARYVVRSHLRPWGRRWTWALLGGNGEPVVQSEPYSTEDQALDGIRALRRLAAHASGPDRVEGYIERRLATDPGVGPA